MKGWVGLAVGLWLIAGLVWAAEPETPAAPPTGDITIEEEAEGEGAVGPFAAGEAGGVRKDAVPGYVELSSGVKAGGRIFTTRGKRLKIYNTEKGIYEHVPVPAVREIEALAEWERMEKEWRFKEAGSPEKAYSGRAYPARKLAYRLTLLGGHTIEGHILGQPLYLAREGGTDRFVLHDRQKGPPDATLADLVYVKRVVLHEKEEGRRGEGTE